MTPRGLVTTVLYAGFLLMTTRALEAQTPFARALETVQRTLQRDLERAEVVGGAFWFVRGDETLARSFHGFQDLAARTPIDEHTIFHWASITKTLTGIATLQLRDRGKLTLDDSVLQHVPELRQVYGGPWNVQDVTLEHLLSHAGGFRETTFPFAGSEDWQPYEPATWEQLAGMFPYTRLHFAPGSRYRYSNPGYVFVGRTIETLTGDDYEVYIDKNILKPLGMHESFFDGTPYHLLRHRSHDYTTRDGRHVDHGTELDTGITVSNGGLNAPIPDLLRYVRFLLRRASGPGDDLVLAPVSLTSMWEPRQDAGSQGDHRRSMGLSFFLYEKDGHRVIGHTGSQRGYQAFFLADVATGAAAIAAFNSGSLSRDPELAARAIMMRAMDALLADVLPEFRYSK
ncbi:MAG: beta-lactamase family protein [Planctomycetes bacterium]|nr:beta-lactamase family protein [Planctomycetota bacterium]